MGKKNVSFHSTPGKKQGVYLLIMLVAALVVTPLQAEMTSANYTMKQDALVVGGNNSASKSYSLHDTIGQDCGTGQSQSSQNRLWTGLWYKLILTSVPDLQSWAILVLVFLMAWLTRRYTRKKALLQTVP
ncbi:hypothetical protein JXQ70_15795 [bacterium]|nr:hypothetical protein [bacterium]